MNMANDWLEKLKKDRSWALEQAREQLEVIEASGVEATIEIKVQKRLIRDIDTATFEDRAELHIYVPEGPPEQ